MKRLQLAALIAAFSFSGILIVLLSGFNDPPAEKSISLLPVNMRHQRLPVVPVAMSFAGEEVPLDHWEVREQLEREILYNYYAFNNVVYMLKLSGRYFPAIEAELKANNIPDDFKYLCVAESNLIENAVSKTGATGFWQFTKGTAPHYSLEISATVDERYHVGKSTSAACNYIKQAYKHFGNWTTAAASHNCGVGCLASQVSFQHSSNYFDLILPDETQRYIFRILAFKYLLTNADSLGFGVPEAERYTPIKMRTITVSNSIENLDAFAKQHGSNYKMLLWLNPWLRARSLRAKPGKIYNIFLPEA